MIEPGEHVLDPLDALGFRQCWALQHDHRKMQPARGGDLAVSSLAAAILGEDGVDTVALEQHPILSLAKRSTRGQIDRLGHGKRRIDGIDASHQIKMLRRRGERRELLPPEREKHAARRRAEGIYRLLHGLDLNPMIASDGTPCGPSQRQQRRMSDAGGLNGIGGDGGGVWMRRIDQGIDPLGAQIFGKAVSAAEPADTQRNGLRQRLRGAAGERQRHGEVGAGGKRAGQFPRFRRAAKDEDTLDAG